MAKKKKGQPQSAIPFFMMAVFAFLAGFPIWLVIILALLGALVLKLEKDKKALSNLPPLPPAESDMAQNRETDREDLLSGPFGRPLPEPATSDPSAIIKAPVPQTYREPVDAPEPPPWISPDYQPYPVATSDGQPVTRPLARSEQKTMSIAPVATALYATRAKASRAHPWAANLRSREGARQAIIAMTVLGQPRAMQPYEFDPTQQSELAPVRPS